MTSLHPRQNARTALLTRLDAGVWGRNTLIETTADLDGFDRDVVDDALGQLETTGEVYTVDGEVCRT